MKEIIDTLPALLAAARDPAALLNLFCVGAVIVACILLNRSNRRYRAEIGDRIAECEDAHLERDKIQLGFVELVTDLLVKLESIGGGRRANADLVEYRTRAEKLVERIHALNDGVLEQRKKSRDARKELIG